MFHLSFIKFRVYVYSYEIELILNNEHSISIHLSIPFICLYIPLWEISFFARVWFGETNSRANSRETHFHKHAQTSTERERERESERARNGQKVADSHNVGWHEADAAHTAYSSLPIEHLVFKSIFRDFRCFVEWCKATGEMISAKRESAMLVTRGSERGGWMRWVYLWVRWRVSEKCVWTYAYIMMVNKSKCSA